MNRSPSFRQPRAAWTLIELLVTVAVIGAVAAILLPVLGRVKEEARTVQCAANIRAYGNALMAFIADHNQSLPDRTTPEAAERNPLRYGSWAQPYLERPLKELRCPLINAEERKGNVGFAYSGNGGLPNVYPRLKDIPAPMSRVVLAAEMYAWVDGFWVSGHMNRTVWGNGNGGAAPGDEGTARRPQYHGSREHRGIHLYFLDGHVQRVSAPDNDWAKGPTYGNATNGGYFYTTGQFTNMKTGKWIIR